MKKLLAMMTAVALGTFAWGDGTAYTGQSFNDMAAGAFTTDMEDGFWTGNPDKTTVSAVSYTYSKESAEKFGGVPAEFSDAGAGNNLAVHTALTAPLYRSVVSGGTAQSMAGGFYFDSLVHFTACDADPELPATENAKLAVWLQDMTEAEPAQAVTNLMITAGYFADGDSTIEQKTYNCGDFAQFGLADGDDWCRLTIKAIDEIGDGSLRSGFVVFVNGMAAAHTGSIGVTGSVVDSLNDQAKQWNEGKQLFPSLVADAATIAQVGFAGQGGVDDISFTRTAPEFAADFEFITLTFDPEKIATLFVTDGKTTKEFTDSPAQYVITSDADKYYYYQAQDGYISVPADKKIAIGDSKTVEITDVAAATFEVGNKKFATWAEAVAEAKTAGAPIMLAGNLTEGIELDDADADITLDLAGKNITVDEGDAIKVSDGTLTIVNSNEEAVGSVTTTDTLAYAVEEVVGTANISAGIFNGVVLLFNGAITGGAFSYLENQSDPETCVLTPPDGYEFVKDNEEEPKYWVLQEVQATEAEVTIDAGTGVTVTVVDGDGNPIESKDKVAVGTELTITATPATDYTLASLTVNGTDFTSGNTYTVESDDAITIAATAEAIPYVAQIEGGAKYLTFAAAFAAAADGATIKILADFEGEFNTGNYETVSNFVNGLTIDLNGKTWTLTGTAAKHERLWEDRKGNSFLIKNGSLKAVPESAAPQSIAFYTYAETLEFNNVALDFSELKVEDAADPVDPRKSVPIVSQNGNVKFTGTTTVTLATNQRLVTILDRASAEYVPGTLTLDVNGELAGDILLFSACKIAVGANTTLTGRVLTGAACHSGFEPAGAAGSPFVAMVGAILPATGSTSATAADHGGQLYTSIEDAQAAIATTTFAKNLIVLQDATKDAFAVVSGTVNFEIPADVTFTATTSFTLNGAKVQLDGSGKITVPAALDIANDFAAAPTGMKVELVKDSTYTYQLVKAAEPKLPGEPVVVDPADADKKVEEMNQNKADYLKAPEGVEFGDGEFANYAKLFTATANAGKTEIAFLLNADGEKAVADAEAAEKSPILTAIAAAEGDSAELTIANPIKGFYYGLKQAGDLKLMKVDQVKLGGAEDVEFSLDKSGAAGFYEIVVSPTKIEVENKGE